jgi:hypothetical protein
MHPTAPLQFIALVQSCTSLASSSTMRKVRRWTSEECEAVAIAWINVSEDKGSGEVKGTDQSSDTFWKKVMAKLQSIAPKDSSGLYHNRELNADRTCWTEKIPER